MNIQITPFAWAKLLFFRGCTENEVSVFGITPNKPTLIEDVALPKQTVRTSYVDIDDQGLAIMCDEQAQKGLLPSQFMRIWIHTHPKGMSATPSSKDEETMVKAFGGCSWAVMMILASDNSVYARLEHDSETKRSFPKEETVKERVKVDCKLSIDYASGFPGTNYSEWKKEYDEKVEPEKPTYVQHGHSHHNYAYSYDPNWREKVEKAFFEGGWNTQTIQHAKTMVCDTVTKSCLSASDGLAIAQIATRFIPQADVRAEGTNKYVRKAIVELIQENGTYTKKKSDLIDLANMLMIFLVGDKADWIVENECEKKKPKTEARELLEKDLSHTQLLTQMLG